MIALFLLPWLAAAAADPPAEAPAEDAFTVIVDISADPARCHAGNALRVKFEALARGRADLQGKCVQAAGFLSGRALFASPAEARVRSAESTRELKGQRVGLYGLGKASPQGMPSRGFYRVVGTVGDCSQLDENAMVMGYCHYTGGPYVAVSQIRRGR